MSVGTDYLQKRFNYSDDVTGMVINLSYLVPAFLMPIAGYIIDKKGRIIQFLYFGGMIELIGHVTNVLLPDCGPDDGQCLQATIPFICYGISYTLNSLISYSIMQYVIDDEGKLESAYGVFSCASNLMDTIAPLVVGYIQDNTTKQFGYFWVEIFFITLIICQLLTTFWL